MEASGKLCSLSREIWVRWGGVGGGGGKGDGGGHQLSSQNLFSHEVCVCVRSPGEAGSEESTRELGFFFFFASSFQLKEMSHSEVPAQISSFSARD